MVELSKKQLTGIVTLVMILAGGITYDINKTYYCEPEGSVKEFVRCSSTSKTCYDLLGTGDRCVGGIWEPIQKFIPKTSEQVEKVKVKANQKWWDCYTNNGIIDSYTRCNSTIYEGYLGEFI